MRISVPFVIVLVLPMAMAMAVAPCGVAAVEAESSSGALATFEGDVIDLAAGWGEATACSVVPEGVQCYRTEAELDRALAVAAASTATTSGEVSINAVCATSLRLYDGTSYAVPVLALSTRLTTINLSTYGFDNLTSSYKVGACDAEFYSGANLGGSLYPGNTSAGAWAATMLSGWNNSVSSVYLY